MEIDFNSWLFIAIVLPCYIVGGLLVTFLGYKLLPIPLIGIAGFFLYFTEQVKGVNTGTWADDFASIIPLAWIIAALLTLYVFREHRKTHKNDNHQNKEFIGDDSKE